MRTLFNYSHNKPPESLQSLELFFKSDKEAVVKDPQKSIKTLFYKTKPNNFYNLKRLNNFILDEENIETQSRLKSQKIPFNNLFSDRNIQVPYSENNNIINSTNTNKILYQNDESSQEFEKLITQISKKDKNSTTRNNNKNIYNGSDSNQLISTTNTKDLNSLYKEFISNVIFIYN